MQKLLQVAVQSVEHLHVSDHLGNTSQILDSDCLESNTFKCSWYMFKTILHFFLYFAVFYQFDDVCMPGGTFSKTREIGEVRLEFIQSTFTHLMTCTYEELSEMNSTATFFNMCLQTRRVCDPGMTSVPVHKSWVSTDVMM